MNTKDIGLKRRPDKKRSPGKGERTPRSDVEVVYTPPKPFNRNRFLLRLATVAAVVLAIVFGMAIFFKVKTVNVAGADLYTEQEIKEAAQIRTGENLLTLSAAKISGRIRSKLPYVDSVRMRIQLPDTVNIQITELDVAYAIEAEDGVRWLMTADGRLVGTAEPGQSYTEIAGVKLTAPEVNAQAVAAEIPHETVPEGEEQTPVTVTEAEKLQTAQTILSYLEKISVVGQVTNVNVLNPGSLELWYTDRYQVLLGDSAGLEKKLESMKSAVSQMGEYQRGTLDCSFTTWPDQVGYTPFSE